MIIKTEATEGGKPVSFVVCGSLRVCRQVIQAELNKMDYDHGSVVYWLNGVKINDNAITRKE